MFHIILCHCYTVHVQHCYSCKEVHSFEKVVVKWKLKLFLRVWQYWSKSNWSLNQIGHGDEPTLSTKSTQQKLVKFGCKKE